MHPRVVHCKAGVPFDRYIGRTADGLSVWGNPFSHKAETQAHYHVASREAAIHAHRAWLATQPDRLLRLGDLRHQTLACWCAPQACHGDFLAELSDALPEGPLDGPTIWSAITPVFARYGISLAPYSPAVVVSDTASPPPSSARAVACVGSRTLTASQLALAEAIGYQLVTVGWTVHSGGAQGADQAFARGAARALQAHAPGGLVIHLPWAAYESQAAADAVRISHGRARIDTTAFTPAEYTLARELHPAPDRLTTGSVTLMARNVRIVFPDGGDRPPVRLIIAWPSAQTGGTGQALRLGTRFGIRTHDLREPTIAHAYRVRVSADVLSTPSLPRSSSTAPRC